MLDRIDQRRGNQDEQQAEPPSPPTADVSGTQIAAAPMAPMTIVTVSSRPERPTVSQAASTAPVFVAPSPASAVRMDSSIPVPLSTQGAR